MDNLSDWTSEDLPKLTLDLCEAKSDIERWGYCLIDKAVPEPLLSQCRNRLTEQAAAEKAACIAFEDGGPAQQWGDFTDEFGKVRHEAFREENGGVNQRVWMLINKGSVFRDLLNLGSMNKLVRYILGDRFIISSFTANIARPGSVAMPLHTDQWWAPEPVTRDQSYLPVGSLTRDCFDSESSGLSTSLMLAPPVVSNVLIMLDAMTDQNGGTRIVPGSHLCGRHPNKHLDSNLKTIAAEGPPGCAIITDGRIWHGTGANQSADERKAILVTYCGPQFRPQENYTIGTRPEIVANASDHLKELLGLKVWCGYGRTSDPTVDFVDPMNELTGELKPE